ncbi:hypothetical protein EAG_12608 [Camponotus floridanus]|uniref:Uncharacterized protein n=1 Tax=Camponotus floridanus TaxID=104421 RepID=E2AJD8_CAMFO|nr:hypothetical protein EAG_12608 [Camponotus floridanus]
MLERGEPYVRNLPWHPPHLTLNMTDNLLKTTGLKGSRRIKFDGTEWISKWPLLSQRTFKRIEKKKERRIEKSLFLIDSWTDAAAAADDAGGGRASDGDGGGGGRSCVEPSPACQSPRLVSSRAVRQVQVLYYLRRGPRSRRSPRTCLARPCSTVLQPLPTRAATPSCPPPARSRRGIDIYESFVEEQDNSLSLMYTKDFKLVLKENVRVGTPYAYAEEVIVNVFTLKAGLRSGNALYTESVFTVTKVNEKYLIEKSALIFATSMLPYSSNTIHQTVIIDLKVMRNSLIQEFTAVMLKQMAKENAIIDTLYICHCEAYTNYDVLRMCSSHKLLRPDTTSCVTFNRLRIFVVASAVKKSRLIFVLGLNITEVNTAIGKYGHTRQRETCARNVSGKGPLVCADRFGSVTAPVRSFKSWDYALAFAACAGLYDTFDKITVFDARGSIPWRILK